MKPQIFIDEITAVQVGEKYLKQVIDKYKSEETLQIVYPETNFSAQSSRIKTIGIFNSFDILIASYTLTRDALNRTQLSFWCIEKQYIPTLSESTNERVTTE